MSKRVLTDWRQRGYLPALTSRGLGRGRGRRYGWDDQGVVEQALLVDELLNAGIRRDDINLVLWLMGYRMSARFVRAMLKSRILGLQKRLTGGRKGVGEIEDFISHFIYQYTLIATKHPQLNLPVYENAEFVEAVLNIFANPGYDLETAPLDETTSPTPERLAESSQLSGERQLRRQWEFIGKHFSLAQIKQALAHSSENDIHRAQNDFVLISSLIGEILESLPESTALRPYRFNAIYIFGSVIVLVDLCLRASKWSGLVDTYLPMVRYYIDRGLVQVQNELASADTSGKTQANDMLTARALQEIGDSEFEILVALYLRHRYSELVGVIRTGSNEFRKPIKCPVDGILYISGPPAQCVAIAATTTDHRELRRKWLGGKKGKSSEKGDIERADNEFSAWRSQDEAPHLKLYLATNRFLKNDTNLYSDVIVRGQQRGIDIEIVEASQLVDFLDFDPEGQFLRQIFLNISAGRLSETLLRAIADKSLHQHARTFSVLLAPENEIGRDSLQLLLETITTQNHRLIAIRGESGSGKSTLVRHAARQIIATGGVALWLSAEAITSHDSIASLLHNLLLRFEPSLDGVAGNKMLELSGRFRGGVTCNLNH